MSPSEFDLRGALADGEGEGIDVEALIGHAAAVRRAQHARRVRWASAAAAAVVVCGGIATGLTALNDSSPAKSSASAGQAGTAAASPAAPEHRASVPSAVAGDSVMGPVQPAPSGADKAVGGGIGSGGGYSTSIAMTCAPTVPKPPAPTLSARISARLLPASVTSMLVCGYDGTGKLAHLANGTEVSATYTGADVDAISNSLAAASATKPNEFCPNVERQIRTMTISAADSRGSAALVVAVPYCGGSVTNGSVTRYDWAPPSQLTNLINAKEPFTR